MIDWSEVRNQLRSMTLSQIEQLEKDDLIAYVDRLGEEPRKYQTFGAILKTERERKLERVKTA